MELLLLFDLAISSGIVFITVWFFFVQNPFLFQRIGREKFVPIMMQITQLYFKFILALNLAAYVIHLFEWIYNRICYCTSRDHVELFCGCAKSSCQGTSIHERTSTN